MEILYELKQVAFEIVINDTQLKSQVAAVKKALASIKGAGVDIKLNVTKAEIAAMRKKIKDTLVSTPITVAIKGTDKLGKNGEDFNKGISRAVVNMQKFLDLMQKASAESQNIRNNLGAPSGGGSRINGGSRTGFTDSAGARLSAFSGFIRGGQSFTSQIGAYASGVGRLGLGALPVAGAALGVSAIVSATRDVTEFGAANANLAAVLGTTRDGISSLTEQAKQLGSEMAFTASEITGAQIELAKLGFTADEIKSSTEGVARFAIVAGADIPEAAEAAGAALQSFGLDAAEMDRVVSVLGVSTAKSALDFEKLKVGIGTTFATAKTFGLEIEDVAALLGELSNKGLSASVAATATRNILLNLSDTNGKLRRTLSSIGVKEVKGLDGITNALRELNAVGIDLPTTFELTDTRSVNAFNSFLRGANNLTELRDSLVDVNDEFKIMEKERLNSLQGSLTLFRSAMERANLTLSDMEGVLSGIVDVGAGFLNFVADVTSSTAAEAIEKERDSFASLTQAIIDSNDNYALRAQLIARLKISYPELVKGIDIEKLSVLELNKFLQDNLVLYEKRINIQVGETDFERALKRENEALQEQAKLISERRSATGIFSLSASNFKEQDIDRYNSDAKKAREDQFLAISSTLAGSGTLSVEQEKRLREIVAQSPKARGGRPTGDAAIALDLLGTTEFLRASVRPNIPNFKDSDFAIPDDGSLSKFEQYQKGLENQLKLYQSNSIQADELRIAIGKLNEVQEKRRRSLDVPKKPSEAKVRAEKAKPLKGSIDFLEAEYQRLLKEIDAVADETLRDGLQEEAEKVRVQIKAARNELVALLVASDEEILKNSLSAIDRRAQLELEANKEIFKDIAVQEAQGVVIIKQAEKDKLILDEAFLKERFEKGLDKTGEYYNKVAEVEAKGREIKKAEQNKELVLFSTNAEKEINLRIDALREIYKNDQDFAKAKELLYLELEASKIAFNAQANKFISASDEKALNDLQERIKQTRAQLNEDVFNRGQENTANSKFNQSFNDQNLTPKEIKELGDIETQLEFEKNKTILENKIAGELMFSEERTRFEKELNQLILSNQQKQYDDKKEKEKKVWDIVSKGADIASQISDKIFEYERAQLDAKADSELESIDSVYQARLKAAQGNAAETARIEQEYELKKKAAQKKFAEERRQLAIKEAIINGALAVIRSFSVDPTGILAITTAIATGIQVATIRAQKFAKGGYTGGKGSGRPDETGHVPVGIVHDGEYVIPKWQVNKNPSLVRALENDRLRGYASGGLATQGLSMQSFVIMADIIAQRVASEVSAATYQGTMMGSERGTSGGLTKAVRETNSRNSAKIINTF